MLRLVNKIPVNTKNVLIHLRYFFINIIIPPSFYKNLIIYDVFTYFLQFLHKPKNSKLYLLYFIPDLSAKLLRYLESFKLLTSVTSSQLSQIEKAVALET